MYRWSRLLGRVVCVAAVGLALVGVAGRADAVTVAGSYGATARVVGTAGQVRCVRLRTELAKLVQQRSSSETLIVELEQQISRLGSGRPVRVAALRRRVALLQSYRDYVGREIGAIQQSCGLS